jgi:Zn-dependent M28 family amino/carboxypeptidase
MRVFLVVLAFIAALCLTAITLVTQPLVTPIQSKPLPVDASALARHVKHLSFDLFPRSHDQLDNIERAAQYIATQFRAVGATVIMQEVRVQETTYKNVIARFGPKEGPLLVIGAHYDSHGDASSGAKTPKGFSSRTHTPGADDNASGVAGLLELARLLSQSSQTRAIELVAYTLEEPPHFRTEHMGSAWHARSLIQAQRNIELMVSLEMIGCFSDEPASQSFPVPGMNHLYTDRGNFIALVGQLADFGAIRRAKALMAGATDLPVYSINAPPFLPGIDFSDHQNYWRNGYPALMVTDTAFFRNQHYHQAGDTFEKLGYGRMAKVVQGVYALTQGY